VKNVVFVTFCYFFVTFLLQKVTNLLLFKKTIIFSTFAHNKLSKKKLYFLTIILKSNKKCWLTCSFFEGGSTSLFQFSKYSKIYFFIFYFFKPRIF